MPLPTTEIGQICKENGIDFILDGAQGVGLLDVDVQKMNVSYMAFPAWKWLLVLFGSRWHLRRKRQISHNENNFQRTEFCCKRRRILTV